MNPDQRLSADAVLELAALTGLPVDDAAMAARIAAGAGAAVAAVRAAAASVTDEAMLFDREPSEYLAVLESLADDPGGASRTR